MGVWMVFKAVRGLERLVSAEVLYCLMAPLMAARAALKRSGAVTLPRCVAGAEEVYSPRAQRRNDLLNSVVEFFPDRLWAPKWRDRAHFSGIEYLEVARRERRPVVLAFCHFGPYFLLRQWLRAAGFPVATLVKGRSVGRTRMKRVKDRFSPFAEIPSALHVDDELRDAVEFLSRGNPLLMAMDIVVDKQIDVPVDAQWRFRMATGPIRLAMRERADLLPCWIIDEGGWRFHIKLGPPAPREILADDDLSLAGKHLLETMLPDLRGHPEQCSGRMLKFFERIESTSHEFKFSGSRKVIA